MITRFNNLFPLWAVLLSALAYAQPQPFAQMGGLIVPLLSLVMFFMGLTLTAADFKRVGQQPKGLGIGVVLQFMLMPSLAWLLSQLLALPPQVAAGLILVGCCSGGTASNVICYLAGGNVALSISMTLVSTILGVALTPWLCWLIIDQAIAVDQWAMLRSIVNMVLLPVLLGCSLRQFFGAAVARLDPVLPLAAIVTIVFIIAIVVALNAAHLNEVGGLIVLAVVLHNGMGLASGYGLSRALGMNKIDSRTIAIEVGMQNSGLGVALALKHFSATAALPGAVFSVWHNISGSLLASWWRRSAPGQPQV